MQVLFLEPLQSFETPEHDNGLEKNVSEMD